MPRIMRLVGSGSRRARTIVHRMTTARAMRALLKASGANTPVANFTTMKLTPQMRAIQSKSRSVAENPAGTLVARSGVSTYRDEAIPEVRWPGTRFKPRRPLLVFTMHVTFALFAHAANLSQEGK